jgi:hypothetical protein
MSNITEMFHNVKELEIKREYLENTETNVYAITFGFNVYLYKDGERYEAMCQKTIKLFLNDDFDPQLLEEIVTR